MVLVCCWERRETGGSVLTCRQYAFTSEMTRASWTGSRLGAKPPQPAKSGEQARQSINACR